MADRMRMTVLEAADALGVSDDTIRRGLEGKGPLAQLLRDAGTKDNTGRWMIELAPEAIERNRSLGRRHRQHTPPEAPLAAPAEAGAAKADAANLRKLAEGWRIAADTAEAAHRAELERLAAAHTAELTRMLADRATELERVQTTHAAELARMQADRDHERVERRAERQAAETERARLIELLADTTAPWWRRLLGRP
jgi:hypothetical protein